MEQDQMFEKKFEHRFSSALWSRIDSSFILILYNKWIKEWNKLYKNLTFSRICIYQFILLLHMYMKMNEIWNIAGNRQVDLRVHKLRICRFHQDLILRV